MNFKITVSDIIFGEFSATFPAETQPQAEQDARDFYSDALCTSPEAIQIVKVNPIQF